jgi:hypothetical protein
MPNIDEPNDEPGESDPEDEAQRSGKRRDSFEDEPTEREVVIPPGEIVPPGEVVPSPDEKIADAAEERRERRQSL